MSVTGERLPSERTILSALDAEARKTVNRAKHDIAPVVSALTPRHSGKTAAALKPRVTRTGTGVALVVAAPRGKIHNGSTTIAQVIRYVTRGTGVYRQGPGDKGPIRGKRRFLTRGAMSVYGREYASVQGQHPNPFIDRIRTVGSLRVEYRFKEGAREAARALERLID